MASWSRSSTISSWRPNSPRSPGSCAGATMPVPVESVYTELSEGRPGLVGALTARAEAQVLRLALIYALADCSEVILRVHLEAALEVSRYCAESASYIFGERLGDPLADEILTALRTKAHLIALRSATISSATRPLPRSRLLFNCSPTLATPPASSRILMAARGGLACALTFFRIFRFFRSPLSQRRPRVRGSAARPHGADAH